MSNNKKFGKGLLGKGYYIALILCALAIGITGYVYYQNGQEEEPVLSAQEDLQVDLPLESQDVEAIATQPIQQPTIPEQTQPTEPAKEKKMQTMSPVSGQEVMGYSVEALCYNQTTRDWRTHNGIDLAAQEGSEVVSAADGEVHSIYEDETLGTTVVIRHLGGYNTKYSSLDKELKVEVGQKVAMGQAIGTVGTTALVESTLGPHVHFSVTYQDLPMDPAEFLSLGK
jgi:murein DD-endopeptidase MepM/ murein hydrolase activator NlpD